MSKHLGEPAVDGHEEVTGSVALALRLPQAGHSWRRIAPVIDQQTPTRDATSPQRLSGKRQTAIERIKCHLVELLEHVQPQDVESYPQLG